MLLSVDRCWFQLCNVFDIMGPFYGSHFVHSRAAYSLNTPAIRPIHTALIERRVTNGSAYKLNGAVNVT